MKSTGRNPRAARSSAYILMEVMLATAIFACAAVALAVALSDTITAGDRLQRESRVIWGLESRMNEAKLKRLVLGKETLPPDGTDIVYEQETSQLDLKNDKNQILAGMYNITITAHWMENHRPVSLVSQKYVYQP